MTTFTAFATTTANQVGADPGVSICDETGELDRTTVDGDALGLEDGALDADIADVLLDGLGYRRTGPWRESGGQWGADAEPTRTVLVGDTLETPADAAEYARAEREALGPDGSEVTDGEIRELMDEAGAAGDLEMAGICEAALDGDDACRRECARVVLAARAAASVPDA